MHNRIGDSSNLLTASSQSEHRIRQNPFIYYKKHKRMSYKNLMVLRKYRVRASVNTTNCIKHRVRQVAFSYKLFTYNVYLNFLLTSIGDNIPNLK